MKARDIKGQRFGRLIAVVRAPRMQGGRLRTFWNCLCDCGVAVAVDLSSLTEGYTTSCGCYQREAAALRTTTHGRSRTRLHRIWGNMINRCTNPNSPSFHNYGGRGIKVCQRWKDSFEDFATDLGEPPSKSHSIDRWPNMNGNYEPGNVRWATARDQGRNRRGLVEVEYQGRRVCLTEAAERAGIKYGTVYSRIFKHGWTAEKALSVPAVMGQKVQS